MCKINDRLIGCAEFFFRSTYMDDSLMSLVSDFNLSITNPLIVCSIYPIQIYIVYGMECVMRNVWWMGMGLFQCVCVSVCV